MIALLLVELAAVGIVALLWSKVSREDRALGTLPIVSFEQDFLYVGGVPALYWGPTGAPHRILLLSLPF